MVLRPQYNTHIIGSFSVIPTCACAVSNAHKVMVLRPQYNMHMLGLLSMWRFWLACAVQMRRRLFNFGTQYGCRHNACSRPIC
eukprot:1147255-Pelagomonas_calceolata.AAC.2